MKFLIITKALFIFIFLLVTINYSNNMEKNYVFNSSLPFILEGEKGNLKIDGIFVNGITPEKPPVMDVLKWKLSSNPQAKEKRDETYQIGYTFNSTLLETQQNGIVWLGHASFLIKINGVTILTDPCFYNLPFIKRQVDIPCAVESLVNIDYLLLSHGHRDHYDRKSVKKIIAQNPTIEVLIPLELSKLLKKDAPKASYQEAAWFQQYKTNDEVNIYFLPAKHWNRRGLLDFNNQLWGSFWIESGGRSIYFAGDSGYSRHFQKIQETLGNADICLMPVGAYKPAFIMKDSHLSPQEAIQAFHDLQGQVFIPMHFATYDLADEPMGEPEKILHNAVEQNQINGQLKILDVGYEYIF